MQAFVGDRPEIERLGGRRVPKVSPQHRHGIVQITLGHLLLTQGRGRGTAAAQWRRITLYAKDGIHEFALGETFSHPSVPWLRFEVDEAFADLEPDE